MALVPPRAGGDPPDDPTDDDTDPQSSSPPPSDDVMFLIEEGAVTQRPDTQPQCGHPSRLRPVMDDEDDNDDDDDEMLTSSAGTDGNRTDTPTLAQPRSPPQPHLDGHGHDHGHTKQDTTTHPQKRVSTPPPPRPPARDTSQCRQITHPHTHIVPSKTKPKNKAIFDIPQVVVLGPDRVPALRLIGYLRREQGVTLAAPSETFLTITTGKGGEVHVTHQLHSRWRPKGTGTRPSNSGPGDGGVSGVGGGDDAGGAGHSGLTTNPLAIATTKENDLPVGPWARLGPRLPRGPVSAPASPSSSSFIRPCHLITAADGPALAGSEAHNLAFVKKFILGTNTDNVCCQCDDGGDLLICIGWCGRGFHDGTDGMCNALGLGDAARKKIMDLDIFQVSRWPQVETALRQATAILASHSDGHGPGTGNAKKHGQILRGGRQLPVSEHLNDDHDEGISNGHDDVDDWIGRKRSLASATDQEEGPRMKGATMPYDELLRYVLQALEDEPDGRKPAHIAPYRYMIICPSCLLGKNTCALCRKQGKVTVPTPDAYPTNTPTVARNTLSQGNNPVSPQSARGLPTRRLPPLLPLGMSPDAERGAGQPWPRPYVVTVEGSSDLPWRSTRTRGAHPPPYHPLSGAYVYGLPPR